MAIIDRIWQDLTDSSEKEREMIYARLAELYGVGFVNDLRNRFDADKGIKENMAEIRAMSGHR